MKNTKQPRPACYRPTEIVWVHGHGHVNFAKLILILVVVVKRLREELSWFVITICTDK